MNTENARNDGHQDDRRDDYSDLYYDESRDSRRDGRDSRTDWTDPQHRASYPAGYQGGYSAGGPAGYPYQAAYPTPYQPTPYAALYQPASEPHRGSRAGLYTTVTVAALAVVGVVAALVVGLGSNAHAGDVVDHAQTHSSVTPSVNPTPTPAPKPSVTVSPTIRLLQTQLSQLNYYDGPINGIDSPALHQAITYLQRDAGLPQTGHLNPATQNALNKMLATGNNQMGAN